MTFLQLCQRARQECGIQSTGPSAVTDQTGLLKKIVDWVAGANNYIDNLHADWRYLHNTATGAFTTGADGDIITKESDHGAWDIESFKIEDGTDDGRPLYYRPYEEYRKIYTERTAQQPSLITELPNGNLKLFYPSDDSYDFSGDYWRKSTDLTAGTDIPKIPTQFQLIIVERVKVMFFQDVEAFNQYDLAQRNFDSWLQKLEDNQLPERSNWARYQATEMVIRPE